MRISIINKFIIRECEQIEILLFTCEINTYDYWLLRLVMSVNKHEITEAIHHMKTMTERKDT